MPRCRAALGALLLAAALGGAPAGSAHAATCGLKELAALPVTETSYGPTIPAGLSGKPVSMLLDTGSMFSVLLSPAVGRLGLTARPLMRLGVFFNRQALSAYVPVSLQLGVMRFNDFDFPVAPSAAFPQGVPHVSGFLGMDILNNVDVELDLGHDRVNLFSQQHCPGQVVYWARRYSTAPMLEGPGGNVYFIMQLNGKKIETALSTASGVSVLNSDAARVLYGITGHSPGVQTQVVATSRGPRTLHFLTMQLSSGGFDVVNARVLLGPPAGNCGVYVDDQGAGGYSRCRGPVPLHIGLDVLRKLRIYLATGEKKLYFTPADATHAPAAAH